MYSKCKPSVIEFKWLFIVLLVLTKIAVSTVMAADSEIASYHGLQPDDFMKSWLMLGPIPVADNESHPDEQTQKQAFDADLLGDGGGELSIRPVLGQD